MKRRWKILGAVAVMLCAVGYGLFGTEWGHEVQFIAGGALVNLGYRMQDHLDRYDFVHDEEITPEEIWREMRHQNDMAATVRHQFPRSRRHPLVAIVACMDGRLDTNELTGDTRQYYYVIRTAGSVLAEKEEDMLELAVQNGVKLIVLTTHTDCAAERAAATPEMRARFPHLVQAVDERKTRVAEFMARPLIAQRIQEGKLAVKLIDIDTMTEQLKEP